MKITDILFVTLVGICIYLIVNTMIEKKLLNLEIFNKYLLGQSKITLGQQLAPNSPSQGQHNNSKNLKEHNKNKSLVLKNNTKKSSSSSYIETQSNSESSFFTDKSQSIKSIYEEENFIIQSEEEQQQVNKENFISENTEDLIDEVINQNNTGNQIVLQN